MQTNHSFAKPRDDENKSAGSIEQMNRLIGKQRESNEMFPLVRAPARSMCATASWNIKSVAHNITSILIFSVGWWRNVCFSYNSSSSSRSNINNNSNSSVGGGALFQIHSTVLIIISKTGFWITHYSLNQPKGACTHFANSNATFIFKQ